MRIAPLLMIVLLVGCRTTYDVKVRNDLKQPVTVWLTKNGPPAEANWLSPEQIAIGNVPAGEKRSDVVVPSGKTAETGKVKGKFPKGTSAVLRVYVGQHTLDELLAMSRPGTSRVDVVLPRGKSSLIIREENGKIVASPAPGKL